APYHVRHILVNIDAGAADIYNGTISEDDARDLSNVVTRLVEGESFGSVAQSKSEDTGSAAVFGDVGIMDLETSFVNEFKLNLYTYDAYFNPEVSDKQNVIDTTFTSDTTLQEQYETLLGGKVFGIPYSAVVAMDYYADKTRSDTGVEVTDATAVNYPRNVLFNNYFNNHSLSFIYLDDVSEAIKDKHSSDYYTQGVYDAANASNNFQTVDGISTNLKTYTEEGDNHATGVTNISGSHKILCDENGNPILVARAGTGTTSSDSEDDSSSGYQGVHFIIVQKNPFTDIEGEYETKEAELEHYYNLDIPSTTTSDGQGSGETYISFINSTDRDNYQERATAIKTEIDNVYSSEFTYRLFNEQLAAAESGNNANDVKITVNEDIKSAITSYIDTELYNNALTETQTYENSWKSFIRLLEVANTYSKRIIPLSGIDAFNNNQITEYNNVRAGESAGN
ncbi:MAG: peptidylprolyl isomerase, partial [Firmicutes bacterium]|nr:peptidylprolyl isomerase [Candidatus Scatoplasma merdavium]